MKLLEDLKKQEGFKGVVYKCSEGFDTIGYGTKLPLNKEESALLLNYRLQKTVQEVNAALPGLKTKPEIWDMLYNMAYQMGTKGLLGFKKMLVAIENKDYNEAYKQGKDSKWYKQTPNRAIAVLQTLKSIKN